MKNRTRIFQLLATSALIISLAASVRAGDVTSGPEIANNDSFVQNRYIVELTEKPLSVKYGELKKTSGNSLSANVIGTEGSLSSQKNKVLRQQETFMASLPSSIKGKNSTYQSKGVASNKLDIVLNAVVLNISDSEIDSIKRLPNVKSVEQVKYVKTSLRESVPLIHAPQVWAGAVASTTLTGRGVSIAIIDTGVDYSHPDLSANGVCFGRSKVSTCKFAGGWDYVNNDADPMDDVGHGTHVAAIAAGNGPVKGVAPDATLYVYKVLDSSGMGTTENVLSALEEVMNPTGSDNAINPINIVNLSLGSNGGSPDDIVSRAVDNVVGAGVNVVVAAGNSGPYDSTISSPGTSRKAITVGAYDKSGNIANFSSRGPVKWIDSEGNIKYLVKPDVAAPGVSICAARYKDFLLPGTSLCNSDSIHIAVSGTSMATPHVSGAIALLLQLHKDWTPENVKSAIRNNSVQTLSNTDRYSWGYGKIDALLLARSKTVPIAHLEPLGIIRDKTNITGTATSPDFLKYELFYGVGKSPNSFSLLKTSNSQVNNGLIYENFSVVNLKGGFYTFRLVVTDTRGNKNTDEALLEVKKVIILKVVGNQVPPSTVSTAVASSTFSYNSNWTNGPTLEDETIFVHFVDSNGNTKFLNSVNPPSPTTQWPRNGIISIPVTVFVPPNTTQGIYKIMSGLYNKKTGARLVLDTLSGDNSMPVDNELRYQVGTLEVAPYERLKLTDCGPTEATTTTGKAVTWNASARGGVAPYRFFWSDVANVIDPQNTNSTTRTYASNGNKYMSIAVKDSKENSTEWQFCPRTVNVSSATSLITISPTILPGMITPGSLINYSLKFNGGPTSENQTIFVHFVDSSGNTKFLNSVSPSPRSTQWFGEVSIPISITVPSDTVDGTYRVMAGLYNSNTNARYRLNTNSNVSVDNELRYHVGDLVVTKPITPIGVSVSCTPIKSSATPGETVKWKAMASGGIPPYTYYWSDVANVIENSDNGLMNRTYTTVGKKYMGIAVTDSANNKTDWAFCSGNINVQE